MSSYENKIVQILRRESIKFEREKTYDDLRRGKYRFDFYIPEDNILIEIDGQFHFKPILGRAALLKQQEHDRRKNSYCLANNIKLYRVPYWEVDNIKKVSDLFNDIFLVKEKFHNDYLVVPK